MKQYECINLISSPDEYWTNNNLEQLSQSVSTIGSDSSGSIAVGSAVRPNGGIVLASGIEKMQKLHACVEIQMTLA